MKKALSARSRWSVLSSEGDRAVLHKPAYPKFVAGESRWRSC